MTIRLLMPAALCGSRSRLNRRVLPVPGRLESAAPDGCTADTMAEAGRRKVFEARLPAGGWPARMLKVTAGGG